MIKFSNKYSKNPVFGHFPHFESKIIFSEKSSCHTQLHIGFQDHAKI